MPKRKRLLQSNNSTGFIGGTYCLFQTILTTKHTCRREYTHSTLYIYIKERITLALTKKNSFFPLPSITPPSSCYFFERHQPTKQPQCTNFGRNFKSHFVLLTTNVYTQVFFQQQSKLLMVSYHIRRCFGIS